MNLVHFAGGEDDEGSPSYTVEIYNLAWEQWDEGPRLPHPLTGPGMAILDGRPALLGGRPFAGKPTDAVTPMVEGEWLVSTRQSLAKRNNPATW